MRRSPSGTSSKRDGRRLAAEVGRGLEDRAHRARPAGRRSGGRRAARGPRGRRAGSGARGWRRPGSPGRAAARPTAAAVRGPRLVDQLAHRQRREVEDRRGLAVVAALEPVDPLDRRRRRAGRRRARRGRRRGRRRRRRRRCSARAPCAPPAPPSTLDRDDLAHRSPHDDALDPGQVAARLDPRRSRPRAAAPRPRPPAPPRPRAPTARVVPACADEAFDRDPRATARKASRPSGPASSASRGSHSVTSGCSAGPVALGDVGRLARIRSKLARPSGTDALERSGPGRRGRAARRWRAPPRAPPAEVSVAVTSQSGQLVGDRQRDRAGAGADVEHPPRAAARAPARPAARSRAAGSAPAGRPPARSGGSPCGRGCRRPARAAAAAAPSRRSAAPRRPATSRLGVGDQRAPARSPVASASSSSASRRGLSTPAAASASTAASSASRTLPRPTPPRLSRPRRASSRWRFSSAASASVNSRARRRAPRRGCAR